jgi:hypothetical protein
MRVSPLRTEDLGTALPERFYSRLGWETWRGSLAGRSDDGLVPAPDQRGVMGLRLSRTPGLDSTRT